MTRTLTGRLIVVALVVLALLLGLAATLPALLAFAVPRVVPGLSFSEVSLGYGRVEARGLQAAGGTVGLDRLTVDFSLRGLLSGRLDRVAVAGLHILVRLDDLNARSSEQPARVILPEIDALEIAEGEFRLVGPAGELVMGVDARLRQAEGGLEGKIVLSKGAQGDIDLVAQPQGFRISSEEPLRLSSNGLFAVGALPIALRQPIGVTLSGAAGEPLDWKVKRENGGMAVQGDLLVELSDGQSRLAAEGAFTVHTNVRGTLTAADVDGMVVDASKIALPSAEIDGRLRLRDLHWPASSQDIPADLELRARGLDFNGVKATEIEWTCTGLLRLASAERLEYTLREPAHLKVNGLLLPEALRFLGPLTAAVGSGDKPLLEISPDGLTADASLTGIAGPFTGVGMSGVRGQLAARSLTLGASSTDFTTYGWQVEIEGGAVRLSEPALSVEDVTASVQSGPTIAVRTGVLRHLVEPPLVRPLTLSASLTPAANGWNIKGELADLDRKLVMRASGRHAPQSGAGSVRLEIEPLLFASNGLAVREISPRLASYLSEVSGRFAASGTVAWRQGRITPRIEVLVQDAGAKVGAVAIEHLNTVVSLNGLAPVSTPSEQILSVGLIEAGLPLTNGEVAFTIRDDALHIQRGSINLAGGRMALGETVLSASPGTKRQPLIFEVADIDLAEIVRLVGLDGLDATGRLAGRIPVTLAGDRVLVEGGRLAAGDPGRLRYRPAERPAALQGGGQSVDLMLKALDDFHYDRLVMTLTGEAGGEMEAKLHIAGKNPDVYEGYPLEFNLNLNGKLDTILQDTLAGYQIPDKIRQRMLEFGSR